MGIGSELVKKMVETLKNMYAIDIICDESVAKFYETQNFKRSIGIIRRNYKNQDGSYKIK